MRKTCEKELVKEYHAELQSALDRKISSSSKGMNSGVEVGGIEGMDSVFHFCFCVNRHLLLVFNQVLWQHFSLRNCCQMSYGAQTEKSRLAINV